MDLDHKDLDYLEEQSFANEVRDHEGRHRAFLLAIFPLAALGLVFGGVVAVYLVGLCLLGAGVAAVRGGKSRVTYLGSPDRLDRPNRTLHERESMTTGQRRHHARVTGVGLIALGVAFIAFASWVAWDAGV